MHLPCIGRTITDVFIPSLLRNEATHILYKLVHVYLHCQIEIMLQSTLNQRPRVETVVCLVNVFYVFEIDDLLLFMIWYEYRNCMSSLFSIHSFY